MFRGFSNAFSFDAYSLFSIRYDQPEFQKILTDTAAQPKAKQVAFFASSYKALIDHHLMQRKGSGDIYQNIWSNFIYHAFLEVKWEEVATRCLEDFASKGI